MGIRDIPPPFLPSALDGVEHLSFTLRPLYTRRNHEDEEDG
jgi:hypothetical protein